MQRSNLSAISVNFEIQKKQEELLERLDKSEFRAVVNVSNCLKIYNSLPMDKDFKKNFFVKLGGVEELVYQNSKMEDSDLLLEGRPIKKGLWELQDSIKYLDFRQ